MKMTSQLSGIEVMYEFLLSEWYKDLFRQFELRGIDPTLLDPLNAQDAIQILEMLNAL